MTPAAGSHTSFRAVQWPPTEQQLLGRPLQYIHEEKHQERLLDRKIKKLALIFRSHDCLF